MAKKRGGLAGLYDRNKGIFRTAAILGGTALGGPAGGALAGAAMRGLDRPGKRGIGFDPFAALPGAVEGYAMGKTAQAVGGGLKNLFAAKGAPAAQAVMPELPGIGFGLGGQAPVPELPPLKTMPGITSRAVGASYDPLADFASKAPSLVTAGRVPIAAPPKNISRLQKLFTGAKENWDVLSGIGEQVGGIMDYQQKAAIERLKAEQDAARLRLEEQRFQLGKQETEADRENRRRLTQLLMPMIQAQMSNVLPSPQPMNR
jgi:hypothetical protein